MADLTNYYNWRRTYDERGEREDSRIRESREELIMPNYQHSMSEPPEITEKRVRARVAGRKLGQEVFKELFEPPDGHGADYGAAFIEAIQERLPQRRDQIVEPEKLKPIARLAQFRMPFGEFTGYSLDDVPLDRLDWYIRAMEDNLKAMKAYRNHPDLQSRRGES